jgi:protein tyrosine phosphatase (PTP) superfamily phosphohydrolase (DUF442 family)
MRKYKSGIFPLRPSRLRGLLELLFAIDLRQCFVQCAFMRSLLLVVLFGLLFSGCATAGSAQRKDPLKNTKKLVKEGHVSLYRNGAFRVPNTSISLVPAGPSTLEFAGELAGMRARQSFETSVKRAADSVYIVSEGTKLTYRVSKRMSKGANAGAGAIRKLTRENGTLLVDRSSDLGKSITGKSWDLSTATFRSAGKAGGAVVHGARAIGSGVSGAATEQGTGLATGSMQAAKDIVRAGSSGGTALSEGGTRQGIGLATGSVRAAKDISDSSAGRSASAIKYGYHSFVQGYVTVPARMKQRAGEVGDSLRDARFAGIVAEENERRGELSQKTVDLMSETVNHYGEDVSGSFSRAGEELKAYRTTGVGFAALRSMRWVLQGILWDASIKPLTKMTAASVGYIGVNFLAFPSLVVVREGVATTQVAVEVTWDTAKTGYDLVAPTGVAAVAGVYGLLDYAGSHIVAGAAIVGGTASGVAEAGAGKAAGAIVKGGSYPVAGATAAVGTVAGYGEAGLGKVAGVVIKGGGYAAGAGVQYIGVPLVSAGIALGGGTIGTAVQGAGMATGGTLYVSGQTGAAATQVFGNVIAGGTLAGGTAVSAAAGSAYGVYELSKAVVVPSGYELGSGIVLSYGTLAHLGAHSILAVSDCTYMVLSLEGPRWVLYAVKGDLGKGDDLPPGAVVDLNAMHRAGEEIYYLPVSDEEMKNVVQSVYDNLPEAKPVERSKAAVEAADLRPFTSDGCSLFPDGTPRDRTQWCDCCLDHDIAYWQGGTAEERVKADEGLRDCVLERTHDKGLAETMYVGVRAGGHPAFPTWYRWGYGWSYGRGYKPLTDAEKKQVLERIDEYRQEHLEGYCGEHGLKSAASGTVIRRPETWATPVSSEHLRNFYRIDDKLYRSAQPDREGFRELTTLGIKNVLSLRDYHSDDDAEGSGLTLFRVEMSAGDVKTSEVVEALRIIKKAEGPVLIHCWHGSDRTGLVSAMYRIVFQGWSKDEAIDELMHGGYGYHSLYRNIPEYIRQADIEGIRKQVSAPAMRGTISSNSAS